MVTVVVLGMMEWWMIPWGYIRSYIQGGYSLHEGLHTMIEGGTYSHEVLMEGIPTPVVVYGDYMMVVPVLHTLVCGATGYHLPVTTSVRLRYVTTCGATYRSYVTRERGTGSVHTHVQGCTTS